MNNASNLRDVRDFRPQEPPPERREAIRRIAEDQEHWALNIALLGIAREVVTWNGFEDEELRDEAVAVLANLAAARLAPPGGPTSSAETVAYLSEALSAACHHDMAARTRE